MLQNDRQIDSLVTLNNLIDPFDKKNLRRASYDICVGTEYFMCDPLDAKNGNNGPIQALQLTPGQSFEIRANSVCFVLSKEKINLPLNISAKISLRMSHVYNGLMLAAQPPFDPGYSGFVVVMLHNLSNRNLPIKEGDRLATVEFYKLKNSSLYSTPASNNVTSLTASLKRRVITSLQNLEDQVQGTKKKVDGFYSQIIAFAALLLAIPAVWGVIQYSTLAEKIDKQNNHIEEHENLIKQIKGKDQIASQAELMEQLKLLEQQNKSLRLEQEKMTSLLQKLCTTHKIKPCITGVSP